MASRCPASFCQTDNCVGEFIFIFSPVCFLVWCKKPVDKMKYTAISILCQYVAVDRNRKTEISGNETENYSSKRLLSLIPGQFLVTVSFRTQIPYSNCNPQVFETTDSTDFHRCFLITISFHSQYLFRIFNKIFRANPCSSMVSNKIFLQFEFRREKWGEKLSNRLKKLPYPFLKSQVLKYIITRRV